MPWFTRWSIRFAMVYFLLSWLFEFWRVGQFYGFPTLVWADRVAVFHLFFVGWLTQLIFGVAYWMFPTQSRDMPRGRTWLSVCTLVGLNLGVVLRVLSEPIALLPGYSPLWRMLLLLAGLLQYIAALCFVVNLWPRIRGPKQQKVEQTVEQRVEHARS